jgi:hypothetical protein
MNLNGTVMRIAVLRFGSLSWMILKDVDLSDADLRKVLKGSRLGKHENILT